MGSTKTTQIIPGASFKKGLRLSSDLGYVRDLNLSLLSGIYAT